MQEVKVAGKRKYERATIRDNKIVCPYPGCDFAVEYNKSGRASMSRHKKNVHERKGQILKTEGVPAVIRLYEKYHAEESKDDVPAPPLANIMEDSASSEPDLSDPTTAADYAAVSDKALLKTRIDFLNWRFIPDDKFANEVPYPVFAKAMMGYALNMGILVKCNLALRDQRHDRDDANLEALGRRFELLQKTLQEYKDDVKKMSDVALETATQFDADSHKIDLVMELKDAGDLRRRVATEARDAMDSTLYSSLGDFKKLLLTEVGRSATNACIKTARMLQKFGVPKEGVLGGPLPLQSAKQIEEEKELLESMPPLTTKSKRQLEAAQQLLAAKKLEPAKERVVSKLNISFDVE